MTRRERDLIRTYALRREKHAGNELDKVRLYDGDAVAYLNGRYAYLFDPITILSAELEAERVGNAQAAAE